MQIAPHPRSQQLLERDRIAGQRIGHQAAAGIAGIAPELGGAEVGVVFVIAIQRAPLAQRLEQDLLIFLGNDLVEPTLLRDLGEQFGHLTLEIRLDAAEALRLAAEGTRRVQIGVVVELDEGFQRHVEPAAVIEQCAMMMGNPPRAGIEVEPLLELAGLLEAAEFGKAVAAADRPVAAASAAVEFEDLDLVAGLAQFQRRRHARKPGAEDQHRGALHVAGELERTLVGRLGRQAEARHRLIHRRTASDGPDQRQQIPPPDHRFVLHPRSPSH